MYTGYTIKEGLIQKKAFEEFHLVSLFDDISTVVDYLMPYLSL